MGFVLAHWANARPLLTLESLANVIEGGPPGVEDTVQSAAAESH